jgi:hypothetical protein
MAKLTMTEAIVIFICIHQYSNNAKNPVEQSPVDIRRQMFW